MLVVAGHVSLDPTKIEDARAATEEMVRETLKEEGCNAYCFAVDLVEEGRIRIFEEWESQEALDLHFKAPHMAVFQAAMGGLGIKEMVVHKYEVSSKWSLG
ncbi:MAG: antibiotic biosynthesis monooxygenase [Deltaproteobacteria bacterium]|nr:antibiotic biosynthesis monooxygenase [Deltaproteobacteria bacterium]